MLALLALLFIGLPIAELAVLFRLGQSFGVLPTVALVLGTGLAGAALAKAEGLRTFRAMQRETAAGRVPGREIMDGIAVLVGGALLLTPGLITDVIGLALLFPPTRAALQRLARRWLERKVRSGAVRVSVMGWGPAGPSGPPGSGPDPRTDPRTDPRLDPRHEIRVPPPDERR